MMKVRQGQQTLWKTPEGYAATHCTQCKAGWTRTGSQGGSLTICLLDREPVLSGMVSCDRYEPREEAI
jgi:hypothetical protein